MKVDGCRSSEFEGENLDDEDEIFRFEEENEEERVCGWS
jgi:hypothetical protein